MLINVKDVRKARNQHKAPTQVIMDEAVDHPAFMTEGLLEYFKVFL